MHSISLPLLALLLLPALTLAQGRFGALENSAEILQALIIADNATLISGQGAAAYAINNTAASNTLADENAILLEAWQNVTTLAQGSDGFYSDEGAQSIIDHVNDKLYPDTRDADAVYIGQREVFIEGGFINYINPGLLKLRTAVDAASAAVQAKTRAKLLTEMAEAFLKIEQDYADTQETQEFGDST